MVYQELMSGEAAKERVTPVPFKSGLLTYFRLAPVKYRPNAASGGWSYGRDLMS